MAHGYEYQPKRTLDDFDAAVDLLAGRVSNRLVRGWPVVDAGTVEAVCRQLGELGLEVRELVVEAGPYRDYMERAGYPLRHPQYYVGNLPEKSLEHYLTTRVLQLHAGDVFVDVASENSALPEIASRAFGARSYAQDIMYPAGVADGRIGGDACDMPVPSGFATKAALTCSIEHFEGDADTRLFLELSRVVAKGGRVFVVPLYMMPEPSVMTDPLVSTAAEVQFDRDAVVYCSKGWGNRHGRFYSPTSLVERLIQPNASAFRFQVFRVLGTEAIDASIYARFALLAERL
jgi:hypothetical protein